MIVKSYDYKKIDLKKNNIILLYGKNEGYKKEVGQYFKSQTNKSYNYDEKQIRMMEIILYFIFKL